MPVKMLEEKKVVVPRLEDVIVLELALYNQYNYHGKMYLKGTPYKFRREDAITLLGERDSDRPVWRQYKPPRKVEDKKSEVVDETKSNIYPVSEVIPGTPPPPSHRLDIGDESDLTDLNLENVEDVVV